ncbi:MAG: SCO family protein [Bdellovibrionales bacterium]|nr:SCO family protein [Bdellovibrionales bacterium]
MNSSLWAYDPNEAGVLADKTPVELEGVGVTEHLGSKLDLDIDFVDQNGVPVKLAQYFGSKPVIFSIVYYDCPSLCNLHLNGLTDALKQLKWTAGNQFDVVALSMNPRETPELAAAKMQSYIDSYGRPESAKGWHFLTGSEENIKKIADQVGFSFKWIEGSQEYSHASAAQVITASGTVSRYLHGIQFDPQTVRLALLEASEGKIGNIVDQFVLYCFQFDPTKKKYTLYAYRIMQAGGVLIVLVLAILLIPYWIRERKQIA